MLCLAGLAGSHFLVIPSKWYLQGFVGHAQSWTQVLERSAGPSHSVQGVLSHAGFAPDPPGGFNSAACMGTIVKQVLLCSL